MLPRKKRTPLLPSVQHPSAQQPQQPQGAYQGGGHGGRAGQSGSLPLPPQGRGGIVGGRGAQSAGGPSRPPPPKLQQASQPSNQVAVALAPSRVTQPDSSMTVRRPGNGSFGSKCTVKANHFSVGSHPKYLYHLYDVSITPETKSHRVNRAVIQQLVKQYKQSDPGMMLSVYDGRKSLYTARSLTFPSKEFKITLTGGARRDGDFKVSITFSANSGCINSKMLHDPPHEVVKVLDIVLRESLTSRYFPVGRSFYSPDLGGRKALGDGLERLPGFYQSIRPTQMGFSLNLNTSSTAFIEPIPVIDFVAQLLNQEVLAGQLAYSDRVKVEKALIGVKVEVTHREENMRRQYSISALTEQPTRELTFFIDEAGIAKSVNVYQYFSEKYKYAIQYTHLPCLQVGNSQRPNYLPMEVCRIAGGQRYSKRLNEKQITALLELKSPKEREADILQMVMNNAYDNDPYAKEFGINIKKNLASVNARVLSPPWLQYRHSGGVKYCRPKVGQWNMMNKRMYNGGRVNNWVCINFEPNIAKIVAEDFCNKLAQKCITFGMSFNYDPVMPVVHSRPRNAERTLRATFDKSISKLKPGEVLDLLVVLLPDNNGPLYGDLKRICETELGIVSQCCLRKHVCLSRDQYFANVVLKINVKVGGSNTVLAEAFDRRIPLISDIHTIIFGADVIHPHPGDSSTPSIAAVVASMDWPEFSQYASSVCDQIPRQEHIQNIYGMIRELLMSYRRANKGVFPKRIIFYRAGVSEGQINKVLLYELDGIRKACESLQPNKPKVTFVVVQKRHNTRLFANDHNNKHTVDSSGNILPGTVVDSMICHPTEFDFYLCSHAGIQGTSCPAHYHVLWDENKFSADVLQFLTNDLCYTYARCTRSVSIVPPVYYAHLAASRARFYMQPDTSDHTEPMASGTAGVPGAAVRPLPQPKENVKRVMFYC